MNNEIPKTTHHNGLIEAHDDLLKNLGAFCLGQITDNTIDGENCEIVLTARVFDGETGEFVYEYSTCSPVSQEHDPPAEDEDLNVDVSVAIRNPRNLVLYEYGTTTAVFTAS